MPAMASEMRALSGETFEIRMSESDAFGPPPTGDRPPVRFGPTANHTRPQSRPIRVHPPLGQDPAVHDADHDSVAVDPIVPELIGTHRRSNVQQTSARLRWNAVAWRDWTVRRRFGTEIAKAYSEVA